MPWTVSQIAICSIGVLHGGFMSAASVGPAALPVQITFLTGGIVAGLFGFAMLTKATIVQAVLGGSPSSP
jgi:hypothetical protein